MFRLLKGENSLESSSIVIFFILNFIVILSSCIIFSWLWEHLYYTDDPFFTYSVLRNILQFKGFYEGPTLGNYLASHTSFTLLFFAPLAGIFKTPAILGYLNIF